MPLTAKGKTMPSFVPVALTQKDAYYEFWEKTPQRSLDYTLANLWGWMRYYGLEWTFEEDLIWIRQNQNISDPPIYWAPVGDWESTDWKKAFSKCQMHDLSFIRVPEKLLHIWETQLGDSLEVAEDRGQWEYLYNQTDLANLAGRKFHKKKNHYLSFVKAYGDVEYHELNNMIVEDVLGLQDEWCQWHECEDSSSLKAENEAINQVLSHWTLFHNLTGGAIYVDNRIAAFSIGEYLDEHNMGVHYEKGLNGYKGIYQAINKEFSSRVHAEFINRAQDLDEEGLRQAKISYNPVDYLKKYKCVVHS